MDEQERLNALEAKLTSQLEYIKEGYIKMRQDNLMSIRKDVIAASLKDIINNCNTVEKMKEELNTLIITLLKPNDFITITKDE